MGGGLVDNVKKALRKRPSSSKTLSNHPLPNDKSRGIVEDRHNEYPNKEDSTTARKDGPYRGGSTLLRKKDVTSMPNLQSTSESMQVFPETQPSPSQAVSNQPRQNDKSCGVEKDQHHEAPTKGDSTTPRKDVPSRGDSTRQKDVSRTQNFESTPEPMQVFP
jgi:hypothetical protein